jgi:L-threonylcarbamoyladenylate synthase
VAQILNIDQAMEAALGLLRGGDVVAVPTETVYGLAGDATNGNAVAKIFEVKGRPRFNPLIAHVAGIAMAERIGVFDRLSRKLAEAFWPGPLTLVVPLAPDSGIHELAVAGLDTVALRMPQGFTAVLSGRLGHPLAAPSANSSGRISATTAPAVAADLGDRIPLIVDGGATQVGLESTIVKAEGERLRLLRPGGIAAELIEAAMGLPVRRDAGADVEAPGMLVSHYAPRAEVRLDAIEILPGEALLAFGPFRAARFEDAAIMLNLSPAGDIREAASNLFSYLRALDKEGVERIAVEPIPASGLGEAINDRLARAAAPRDTSGTAR